MQRRRMKRSMIQRRRTRTRWCRMSRNGKEMTGWLACGLGRRGGRAMVEEVEVSCSFCFHLGRTCPVVPTVGYSHKVDLPNLSSSLGIDYLAAKMEAYVEMRAAVEVA